LGDEIEWRECENHPYADGNPYRGINEITAGVFARLATEWEKFTATPVAVYGAGDLVVVEGRYAGHHAGSGKALDAQFAHVWQVRDGKAVRFQGFADTLAIAEAMR
jgi:hypothetical protein